MADVKFKQPQLNWDYNDVVALAKLFQPHTNWGEHVKGWWNQGGLCNNRAAIMTFTYNTRDNDLWLRTPTFNYQPPLYHPGWYQTCNTVPGSTGIYACWID